jgi:hypothetical protein
MTSQNIDLSSWGMPYITLELQLPAGMGQKTSIKESDQIEPSLSVSYSLLTKRVQ